MKKVFLLSCGFIMALSLFLVSCDNGDDFEKTDNGNTQTPPVIPDNAVDLGLPSGLKWASCNIGATVPEEYGGYFAWGLVPESSKEK